VAHIGPFAGCSTYKCCLFGTPALVYIRQPNPLATKLRFCLVLAHMIYDAHKNIRWSKRGGASWGFASHTALNAHPHPLPPIWDLGKWEMGNGPCCLKQGGMRYVHARGRALCEGLVLVLGRPGRGGAGAGGRGAGAWLPLPLQPRACICPGSPLGLAGMSVDCWLAAWLAGWLPGWCRSASSAMDCADAGSPRTCWLSFLGLPPELRLACSSLRLQPRPHR
jgi:hypothetical protein